MLKNAAFYVMMFIGVVISIYDIYWTVKVGTDIQELNPLARYILMYGTKNVTTEGIAYLVTIKATTLCLISVGTAIYHYSKNKKINLLLYILCTIFFVEHLLVLYYLVK